jgi:hypothetical protein
MRALVRLALLLLTASACSPTTIEVKDRKLSATTAVGVDATSLCNGQPFRAGTYDFSKELAEAGIDLSQGCLRSASFDLISEYADIGPGAGCAAARGTVTLSAIILEARCTRGLERQTLRTPCASPPLEVADGTQVFNGLNACLDEVKRTQTEALRTLINSCKPTTLTLWPEGLCSADLCFSGTVKFNVATRNVVVQLGDDCP